MYEICCRPFRNAIKISNWQWLMNFTEFTAKTENVIFAVSILQSHSWCDELCDNTASTLLLNVFKQIVFEWHRRRYFCLKYSFLVIHNFHIPTGVIIKTNLLTTFGMIMTSFVILLSIIITTTRLTLFTFVDLLVSILTDLNLRQLIFFPRSAQTCGRNV